MKMKFLSLLSALTLSTLIGAHTNAQLPPAQNPLQLPFLVSRSVLGTFAVESAALAQAGISASTENFATYQCVAIQSNHTSADILNALSSIHPSIGVDNVNDPLHLWLQVQNADGDILFYGNDSGWAVYGPGGYYLPTFNVTLVLADSIPISFSSPVSDAYMRYTDASGQTQGSNPLYVRGNKVYFNTDDVGSGDLVVDLKDGTHLVYDLRNGGRETSAVMLTGGHQSATIEGFVGVTVTGVTNIVDIVKSSNGIVYNHAYELNVVVPGNATVPVTLSIRSSEGYYPIGFMVRQRGTTNWQNAPAGSAINFGGTVWYVIPVWNPQQLSEPTPNQNGGYGPVTTTMENAKGAGSEPTPATNSGQ